jgi:hypothetical protein
MLHCCCRFYCCAATFLLKAPPLPLPPPPLLCDVGAAPSTTTLHLSTKKYHVFPQHPRVHDYQDQAPYFSATVLFTSPISDLRASRQRQPIDSSEVYVVVSIVTFVPAVELR